ncbi:MAG TPA: glycerophosphodiester phosphodiesterase [Dehalococcoidia bacterium]|nr:glycerophosphodiester phosphodiesterase [Dehalococcoidia bacterium]
MKRVLNIAHRGFTRQFPDNTLEAFEAAIRIPVDGIECDVHETADHRFVIFHDDEIDGRDIGQMTLEEIGQVKLRGKYRVPTLEQTLELCRGKTLLNIEIKRVSSLDRFLELVRERLQPEEVVFSSFNRDIIIELARLAPEIQRGILSAYEIKDPVRLAKSASSGMVVARFPSVSNELVRQVRDANLMIFVWGCVNMAEVRSALTMDIDGVITDFPDEVHEEFVHLAKD